jgi:hypothetical protein
VETAPSAVYEPRNPRASPLYALVDDYFQEFERVYDDRYQQQYGRWRPVIGEVMRKYLECGFQSRSNISQLSSGQEMEQSWMAAAATERSCSPFREKRYRIGHTP